MELIGLLLLSRARGRRADVGERGRRRPGRHRFRPGIAALEERALLSTVWTVTNLNDSGSGSLRAQIGNAADGDTIAFAKKLSGTITLTSGVIHVPVSLTIAGPGANKLSVSGGGNSGVFEFDSPFEGTPIVNNVSDLTVTGGDPNDPAVLNFGATLTFTRTTFSGNQGGALANLGILNLVDSTVANNSIGGPDAGLTLTAGLFNYATANIIDTTFYGNVSQGQTAVGAAILTGYSSTLNVIDSLFQGNQAQGGYGGASGGAIHGDYGAVITISDTVFRNNVSTALGTSSGGAIDVNGGVTLTITDSRFDGNLVTGSGNGNGGAINNFGVTSITDTTFTNNQALGTAGAGFEQGGAISNQGAATLTVNDSVFSGNTARTIQASYQGVAAGGAVANLFNATAIITDTVFKDNQAIGANATSPGDGAGSAYGGAIQSAFSSKLTAIDCTFKGNQAIGGNATNGTAGGNAWGGAISSLFDASLTVTDSTIKQSLAQGGAGGGNGFGGGLYIDGTTSTLTDTSIIANTANGGSGGGQGVGGGLYINSGVVVLKGKTKVKGNHASTANDDIFGTYTT